MKVVAPKKSSPNHYHTKPEECPHIGDEYREATEAELRRLVVCTWCGEKQPLRDMV